MSGSRTKKAAATLKKIKDSSTYIYQYDVASRGVNKAVSDLRSKKKKNVFVFTTKPNLQPSSRTCTAAVTTAAVLRLARVCSTLFWTTLYLPISGKNKNSWGGTCRCAPTGVTQDFFFFFFPTLTCVWCVRLEKSQAEACFVYHSLHLSS